MRHMPRPPSSDLSPITLRIADACRITGIGRSKFYELIKAGEIEVIKVATGRRASARPRSLPRRRHVGDRKTDPGPHRAPVMR